MIDWLRTLMCLTVTEEESSADALVRALEQSADVTEATPKPDTPSAPEEAAAGLNRRLSAEAAQNPAAAAQRLSRDTRTYADRSPQSRDDFPAATRSQSAAAAQSARAVSTAAPEVSPGRLSGQAPLANAAGVTEHRAEDWDRLVRQDARRYDCGFPTI